MAKKLREIFKVVLFKALAVLLPGPQPGWKKVDKKNRLDLR